MMKFFLGCLGLIAVPAVYSLHASCAQTQSFNPQNPGAVTTRVAIDGSSPVPFAADALAHSTAATQLENRTLRIGNSEPDRLSGLLADTSG